MPKWLRVFSLCLPHKLFEAIASPQRTREILNQPTARNDENCKIINAQIMEVMWIEHKCTQGGVRSQHLRLRITI